MAYQPKESVYLVKQQQFNNIDEAFKDFRVQRNVLYDICKDYPSVAAMMVLSEVNGSYALKRNSREGLVGHPKIEFFVYDQIAKKINIFTNPHIHIYIVGEYSATVGTIFVTRMCKRFYRKHPNTKIRSKPFLITKSKDNKLSLKYLYDQARNVRFIGDRSLLLKFNRDVEDIADIVKIPKRKNQPL